MGEGRERQQLSREERAAEAGHAYAALLAEPPRRGFVGSAAIAVVLHFALFLVMCERPQVKLEVTKPSRVINLSRPSLPAPRPPPPAAAPVQQVPRVPHKVIAVPDPDPEEPEPVMAIVPQPAAIVPADTSGQGVPEGVAGGAPGGTGPASNAGSWGDGGGVAGPPPGFKPARIKSQPKPIFPEMARVAGIRHAKVKVLLTIGADGKVKDVRWLEGLPIYEDAVLKAIRQWVYQPATQDGVPVEYTSAQAFVFKLE